MKLSNFQTNKKLSIFIVVTNDSKYGLHGYDNEDPSMYAMFMAKGPLFSKGKQIPPINMIDLYNLFCMILGIKGNENDGSTNTDIWNDLFTKLPRREFEKGKHI